MSYRFRFLGPSMRESFLKKSSIESLVPGTISRDRPGPVSTEVDILRH